jgi:hypothetical protein
MTPVTADFGFGQNRPPVRWMLEAAIVVELALVTYVEAGIIALLLGLNAALGLFQESRRTSPPASLTSAATTAPSEPPRTHFCCRAVSHPAALDRGCGRKPRLQRCKRRLLEQSTLFQCPPRPVLVSDRDGGNV